MERLNLKCKDAVQSVKSLEDILKEPVSIIIRDATIQRFEYTFEAFWKFVHEYLKNKEGKICNSPKSCFRELFALEILNEEETEKCLVMTDMRNTTSHTYKEEVAKAIYAQIPEYCVLMKKTISRLEKEI